MIVLARRRITLAWIAEALHALHVPCVAAEELRLADVIEVNDLVAVLDVLVSHGNDLALAHALKSPLFGANDAELLALSQRVIRHAAAGWWGALMAWHDAPPALQRARTLLAQWSDDARRLPPHDLLDRVVHQGDLMARLAAAVPADRRVAALAAVNALIALSLSLEGGRHASVYRFVRALRQRALGVKAPARSDAVQLMTIHAVKGLEARCVWVADADPQENPRIRTRRAGGLAGRAGCASPRRVRGRHGVAVRVVGRSAGARAARRAARGTQRAVCRDDACARTAAVQPHAATPQRGRRLVVARAAAQPGV